MKKASAFLGTAILLLCLMLSGCGGEGDGSPAADGDYPVATDVSQLVYSADEDGNMTVTGYTGTTPELVIPQQIEGKPVVAVAGIRNHPFLTSVTLPESVTTLREEAFADSAMLREIVLPIGTQNFGASVFFGTAWLRDRQNENPLVIVNHVLVDAATAKGEVVVPDTVTAIASAATTLRTEITALSLPATLTYLAPNAISVAIPLVTVDGAE